MTGFIILHLESKFKDEFYDVIPQKLANGEFKYTEEVTKGLDKVGEVILNVQKGKNKAKAVIQVAEE
jgi:NADPH-dependent curcumin reductase CurA